MAISRDRTGFGTVQNLEKVVFAYHGAAVRRRLLKLRANLVHGQCAVVYGACRLTIQCAQRLGRHNAEMRKQLLAHFLVDRHSALHIAGAEQTAHEVLIQILLIRLNMNRPTAQRNGFGCALLLFEQLDRTGCRTGVQAVIVGHDWNSPDFIGHARQRIAGIQCQCRLIFRQTDIVISGGKATYNSRTGTDSKYAKIDNTKVDGKYTIQLGEDLYDGDLVKADGADDDFGRPSVKWTYENKEIGTYADDADAVYTATVEKQDLYDLVGSDVYNDLKNGDADFSVVVDGVALKDVKLSDYIVKNNDDDAGDKIIKKGATTEVFIDDDSNDVVITVINSYVAQVDGDYDKNDEELDLKALDGTALPTTPLCPPMTLTTWTPTLTRTTSWSLWPTRRSRPSTWLRPSRAR